MVRENSQNVSVVREYKNFEKRYPGQWIQSTLHRRRFYFKMDTLCISLNSFLEIN